MTRALNGSRRVPPAARTHAAAGPAAVWPGAAESFRRFRRAATFRPRRLQTYPSARQTRLKMTDTEAAKFWSVYDQYVTELISINDKKFGLIQDCADNCGKLTTDQSLMFSRQWLDTDIAVAQLRQKYVPIVAKVLDGRKTATFFQLDRRIAMMIELQLSSQMPLVQEQAQ